MRVVLIDNYDSYTNNVAHLVGRVTGALPWVVKNDRVTLDELRRFRPEAIILSPGPGRPDVARDVGICLAVIDAFPQVPTLGLCLGHQLIAVHFGASIVRVPEPRHGTTVRVTHENRGLFAGLPNDIRAMRYHSLTVTQVKAPLIATAWGDGEILALEHTERPLHGLQFHPESIASEHGLALIERFLAARSREVMIEVNAPPDAERLFEGIINDGSGFLFTASDFSHLGTGREIVARDWDELPLTRASGVTLPFSTGLMGVIPYEGAPMRFFDCDEAITVDHKAHKVFAVARSQSAAEALKRRVETTAFEKNTPSTGTTRGGFLLDEHAYTNAIERCFELIRSGEAYELCLTNRYEGETTFDGWSLYRRLRARNPSPYSAFFRFGDCALVLASPERYLRVTPDGIAETRPIKGTRPRGASENEDTTIARALEASEKDRRENLMIVDVARHDLGEVAELGSVEVPDLLRVERHPTVFQLVSTVRAKLRCDKDAIDAARALFPPASMTGAPKARAIEWLEKLEPTPRGFYSGAAGYFSRNGNADLAVVIRSVVLERNHVRFGCGGAIVLGSDASDEWREAMQKAKALLFALGVE